MTHEENGVSGVGHSEFELDEHILAVEKAAVEWGVHTDELEGRFVSALLMAIKTAARSNIATIGDLNKIIQSTHQLGNTELAKIRSHIDGVGKLLEGAKEAVQDAKLAQAHTQDRARETIAHLAREMGSQLLSDTQKWLLLTQRTRYQRQAWILSGCVSAFAFVLVISGYEARAWQDAPATEALSSCAASSFLVKIGSNDTPGRACLMSELTPRPLSLLPGVLKSSLGGLFASKAAPEGKEAPK